MRLRSTARVRKIEDYLDPVVPVGLGFAWFPALGVLTTPKLIRFVVTLDVTVGRVGLQDRRSAKRNIAKVAQQRAAMSFFDVRVRTSRRTHRG